MFPQESFRTLDSLKYNFLHSLDRSWLTGKVYRCIESSEKSVYWSSTCISESWQCKIKSELPDITCQTTRCCTWHLAWNETSVLFDVSSIFRAKYTLSLKTQGHVSLVRRRCMFCLCLKTFVAPFLLTQRTAPWPLKGWAHQGTQCIYILKNLVVSCFCQLLATVTFICQFILTTIDKLGLIWEAGGGGGGVKKNLR